MQRVERRLLERLVVFAGEDQRGDVRVRLRPDEVRGIAQEMAVDEGEESVDPTVVPAVHPPGLDLLGGQVVVLQELLEAKELEHFVVLARRNGICHPLVDDPVQQHDVVFRHDVRPVNMHEPVWKDTRIERQVRGQQ